MSIGSLFSGVGGLELGLERAGLGPVRWQVEIEPFCRRVLARHWPEAVRHDDVRNVGADDLDPVDVMCGGFPCQDISSANRGRGDGLDGPKSGLWYEYLRIIEAVGPRVVVIENVAKWRAWLPDVRRGLWGLGYAAVPIRLCASEVGAPHHRARVFVVAYADEDTESACALHAEASRVFGLSRPDGHWRTPPPGGWRVDDGTPDGMDRGRACGNAVVPQCAEVIGRLIVAAA